MGYYEKKSSFLNVILIFVLFNRQMGTAISAILKIDPHAGKFTFDRNLTWDPFDLRVNVD